MPQTAIFDFGDLNNDGVCHAICGQWIRLTRTRGTVSKVSELGDAKFLKLVWDDPKDHYGINKNNLLGKPAEKFNLDAANNGAVHPQVLAAKITGKWNSYFMMSFWGGGEGHSIAAKLFANDVQFLDPNFSCWKFDNSQELFAFLPGHVSDNYSDLLAQVEIIRWQ